MNDIQQLNQVYQIGGVTYRMEPLSWQQNKWLGEHIFHGLDLQILDYAVVHDLLREKGPLFMAICLLAEGQTRKEQAKQPFSAIVGLAQDFAGELTGGEVALFGPHFFSFNPPSQLAMLVSGRVLVQQFTRTDAPSPAPGTNGLPEASSHSATEMSPESGPSSPSGDPLIQIHSSSAVSSDAPSILPSSDGLALSSHG